MIWFLALIAVVLAITYLPIGVVLGLFLVAYWAMGGFRV